MVFKHSPNSNLFHNSLENQHWYPNMEVWKMILLFNWVNFRFQLLLLRGEFVRKLHESFKKSETYAKEEYPSNADIQTVTTKGSPGSLRKQFLFLCDVWILWFVLYSMVVSGSLFKGGIGSIWYISRKRKVWLRCLLQCPQRSLVRVVEIRFFLHFFVCPPRPHHREGLRSTTWWHIMIWRWSLWRTVCLRWNRQTRFASLHLAKKIAG